MAPWASRGPAWRDTLGMSTALRGVRMERPWPPALTIGRSSSGMPPRANCWQTYRGHTDSICSVAWSPDGKTLASSSGDTTLKLWDAAAGTMLESLQGYAED